MNTFLMLLQLSLCSKSYSTQHTLSSVSSYMTTEHFFWMEMHVTLCALMYVLEPMLSQHINCRKVIVTSTTPILCHCKMSIDCAVHSIDFGSRSICINFTPWTCPSKSEHLLNWVTYMFIQTYFWFESFLASCACPFSAIHGFHECYMIFQFFSWLFL